MVEISLSGSGEGLGGVILRGYSTEFVGDLTRLLTVAHVERLKLAGTESRGGTRHDALRTTCRDLTTIYREYTDDLHNLLTFIRVCCDAVDIALPDTDQKLQAYLPSKVLNPTL